MGLGRACLAPEAGEPMPLPLPGGPALCTLELLQGRCAGGLGLSRGFHSLGPRASQSSQAVQALCGQGCVAAALQDCWVPKGFCFSGELPGLWEEGPCLWAPEAHCELQACPANALQGRREKWPNLSWGLSGLWKEQSCPWVSQALCGQDSHPMEELQGSQVWKLLALSEEERSPSVMAQGLLEKDIWALGSLQGPFLATSCSLCFVGLSSCPPLRVWASSRPAWICWRRSRRMAMAVWMVAGWSKEARLGVFPDTCWSLWAEVAPGHWAQTGEHSAAVTFSLSPKSTVRAGSLQGSLLWSLRRTGGGPSSDLTRACPFLQA